jgi:hypothetical protein
MLGLELRRQKHPDAQRITGLIRYPGHAFAIREPSARTVKLVPPAGLNLKTHLLTRRKDSTHGTLATSPTVLMLLGMLR